MKLRDHVVVDCEGEPLEIGSKIEGGNDALGTVLNFDSDGRKVDVVVEWPDAPIPETFPTKLRFMSGFAVLYCEGVEAAV